MMHPQPSGLAPSRKDKILLWTLVGWFACAIFSFVGYMQANEDLAQMDAGAMDDRDREQIKLMKIFCLVNIGLTLLSIAAGCCYVGVAVALNG
jgi:putative Mn2+ efflux pump MntP